MHRARRSGCVGEHDALGDEAPRAGLVGGGDEVAGALAAQPVREREVALDRPRVQAAGDRGELVDHGLRPGLRDGGVHRRGVERVGDDGLGTGGLELVRPLGRARHPGHAMAVGQQQRHELAADRAGGACEEDPHGCLL